MGLAYLLAGLAVIFAQVTDVEVQWSLAAPAALLLLGIGLLVTALVDTHLRRRPGDR